MKILNLKNLKNLRQSGLVLKGNFGVTALRNPSGSIAYRFQKRIKNKNNFRCTLGYFPQMTIRQAEEEAMRISALCQQGVHPRKHDKKQEADRRYRQEQQEKAAANRRAQQREIELAKQRLEIEKRRVAIEEERAHRDKWNNISKGLQSLSDSLYGNQNQKNDDYQKQLCINSCRTQGDNYSYCQRVRR